MHQKLAQLHSFRVSVRVESRVLYRPSSFDVKAQWRLPIAAVLSLQCRWRRYSAIAERRNRQQASRCKKKNDRRGEPTHGRLFVNHAHTSIQPVYRLKRTVTWLTPPKNHCPRMEKSWTVWCVVNMFHKNGMRSLIIANSTTCYSILYCNSIDVWSAISKNLVHSWARV